MYLCVLFFVLFVVFSPLFGLCRLVFRRYFLSPVLLVRMVSRALDAAAPASLLLSYLVSSCFFPHFSARASSFSFLVVLYYHTATKYDSTTYNGA